jgi:hypothetical protein
MADSLRREQVAPAAGAWTDLLTAAGQTVISTVRASNTGTAKDVIDARIVFAGEAEDPKQYVMSSMPLPSGRSYSATEGWTLIADDKIVVRSQKGITAFSAFGVEKG